MRRIASVIVGMALLSPPAFAQDPDVVFWQSIQNSSNPAEYQAYLDAFPNGLFAGLARIRLVNPPLRTTVVGPAPGVVTAPGTAVDAASGTAPAVPATGGSQGTPIQIAPNVGATPSPAAVVAPAAASRVRLSLNQASYAPGQPIQVRYAGMPPYQGEYIIIVPSSTPDNVLSSPVMQSAANRDAGIPTGDSGVVEFGPLAPGVYEARAISQHMNVGGRWEVVGRQAFTVQ